MSGRMMFLLTTASEVGFLPPMIASMEKEFDHEVGLLFLEREDEGDVCTVVVGDPFMLIDAVAAKLI